MIKFEVGDLVYFPKGISLYDDWTEYEKTTLLLILKIQYYKDNNNYVYYEAFDGINKVTIDRLIVDLCIKIDI